MHSYIVSLDDTTENFERSAECTFLLIFFLFATSFFESGEQWFDNFHQFGMSFITHSVNILLSVSVGVPKRGCALYRVDT